MKKIFTLIFAFACQFGAHAQNPDSIPNPGFEQWFISQWFDFPAGWMTNNSQILAPTVVRDTDEYSGFLAMQLINAGAFAPHASSGFPVQHHPATLNGYLKNNLATGDSGIFTVWIYYQQNRVDSGQLIIHSGNLHTYEPFNISISQNDTHADSCVIDFIGGEVYLSVLVVDELTFSFPQAISGLNAGDTWIVCPNPFSGNINLINKFRPDFPVVLTIYSSSGKMIFNQEVREGNIDLSFMSAGMYLFELNDGKSVYRKSVIRENK